MRGKKGHAVFPHIIVFSNINSSIMNGIRSGGITSRVYHTAVLDFRGKVNKTGVLVSVVSVELEVYGCYCQKQVEEASMCTDNKTTSQ